MTFRDMLVSDGNVTVTFLISPWESSFGGPDDLRTAGIFGILRPKSGLRMTGAEGIEEWRQSSG